MAIELPDSRPVDRKPHAGLFVQDVVVAYGDVVAVQGLSIAVQPGQIVALLGANGAGKSSFLNCISGLVPAAAGSIMANGSSLDHLSAEARARYVTHVPEGRRLFSQHSVQENLILGAFSSSRDELRQRLDYAFKLFPPLQKRRHQLAGTLSGGEQQMVALARGLMSRAPVVMIDELSLGLAPIIASGFVETLRKLRDEGFAILLVEQYVTLALRIADQVVVLDRGSEVLAGQAHAVRDEVLALEEAYFGSRERVAPELDDFLNIEREQRRPGVRRIAPLILGALIVLISTVLPWFSYETGTKTGTLTGWNLPLAWIVPTVCLSVVALGSGFWRLTRRRPVSLTVSVGALTSGVGVLGLLLVRTWLFQSGLPNAAIALFTRQWGLLLALVGTALLGLGVGMLFIESLAARRASRLPRAIVSEGSGP